MSMEDLDVGNLADAVRTAEVEAEAEPGRTPTGRVAATPRRMQTLHREIIRLALNGALTHKDIASIVGCHPITVNTVVKHGAAAQKLCELQDRRDEGAVDFAKEVRDLVPEAIRIYEEILLDPHEDSKVKKSVADQVLDRGGIPRQTSVSATVMSTHVSEADIKEIKDAALKTARELGMLAFTPTDQEKEGDSE